jgi:transcriptional regulator with XRE-family HTH domain
MVKPEFGAMPRKTIPANVVGPQIRKARRKLELTQAEFVARCQLAELDISRSTLGQIEARLRFVSDEELIVLASLLGVATDQLYPEELTRRLRGKSVRVMRKRK